jgi:integrase
MAFLRKFPRSPYYFAGFTLPDGRRVQRSTKRTEKKAAQVIADAWEKAAKLGAQNRLSEVQARRIIAEIFEAANGELLPMKSARVYLTEWAETRRADTAPRTHAAYAQIARDFIVTLGQRADVDVSGITKADVATYRDAVAKRTSAATANKALKYLRIALKAALMDGYAQDNPAAKVASLKIRDSVDRRAFTLTELRRIVENASGEWRGIILCGLYLGQRLKDIATLTWANVDLQHHEIRFVTRKTGRQMVIPMAEPVVEYLANVPAADDPSAPLFPASQILASKTNGESRLSQQFHAILVAAGLARARSRESTGLGRSRRRTVSEISFHSLRHTATSLLKNAGVSEVVAMDIVGHDSRAISRHYTHVDSETKRVALQKLPRL